MDYITLNFPRFLDIKKNGGEIRIPYEVLRTLSQEQVDVLTKYIFNTPEAKKKFLEDIQTDIALKRDFVAHFASPVVKQEVEKIEQHFKKYPNLNYPVSMEIYNYPYPELLVDLLEYKGIITKEQKDELRNLINTKSRIILKPPSKVFTLTDEELFKLVYPKPIGDIFKYQTAYSELNEAPLDPSPNLFFLSLPFATKSALLRGFVSYDVVREVSKEIVAPAVGYASEEDKEKIAEITTTILAGYGLTKFLLKNYLQLSSRSRIPLLRKITTSYYLRGDKLKRDMGKAVADTLGLPDDVVKHIPKYGDEIEDYITYWISRSPQPLNRTQMQVLTDFMYTASHTKDGLYLAGRIWRLPSVGGVNTLHWAEALEIAFGKGAGKYIDRYALFNIPLVRFALSYSRPATVDVKDVYTQAHAEDPYSAYNNIFSRPYALYPKPATVEPSVVKPKVKIPVEQPPAVKVEKPITPKPVIRQDIPKFVIPHTLGKPEILKRIEKAFNVKIEEIEFKKISDEQIGFNIGKSKNILFVKSIEGNIQQHFNEFISNIKQGESFHIVLEKQKLPQEIQTIQNLLNSKFHSWIADVLQERFYVEVSNNILSIVTPNFAVFESHTNIPDFRMGEQLTQKSYEYVKSLLESEPKKYYAVYSKKIPEVVKIENEFYMIRSKRDLNKANKLLKLARVDAYNMGVIPEKQVIVVKTSNKKILLSVNKITEPSYIVPHYIEPLDEKVDFTKYKREVSLFSQDYDEIEKYEMAEKSKDKTITAKTFVWNTDDENAYTFLNRITTFLDVNNYLKFTEFVEEIAKNVGEKLKPKIVLKRKGFKKSVLGAEAQKTIFLRYRGSVTALHEIGHYLHEVISGYTDLFADLKSAIEQHRNELRTVSKYVRPVFNDITLGFYRYRMRWNELFADYFVMYLLTPDLAVELAPNFTEKFENWVKALNLSDVINKNTAEVFFNTISTPQKSVAESLADREVSVLEDVVNKFEQGDLRQNIRELLNKYETQIKNFGYFFLDTFSKIYSESNPVLTDLYLKLVEATVTIPNIFDNEIYEDFHKISKILPTDEKEIKAFQNLIEYHLTKEHKELVDLENLRGLVKPDEFKVLEKVYPVYRELLQLVNKITKNFIKIFSTISPEEATNFEIQFSKKPYYLPLATSGDYILYIEQTFIHPHTKKMISYPAVFISNDVKQMRELIKIAVKSNYKFRLYGFDGFYTVFKTEKGEVDAVITTFDYEKHKSIVDRIKNDLSKKGIKYDIIQGNAVYDDEHFYTQLPYGMFSVAEILSILEKRGLKLSHEEKEKIYDILNFKSPNLLHANFRLWNYFTPQDLFTNISNYARLLRNYLMHRSIKTSMLENEDKFRTLTPIQQQIIKDFLNKTRGEYRDLTYYAGAIISAMYLSFNPRFYYQNILQVPCMLKYLMSSYGFLETLKSYFKAMIYLSTFGKVKVSKYQDVIDKIYKLGEKTLEFRTDISEELAKIHTKAINVSRNVLKGVFNAIYSVFSVMIKATEQFNRRSAFLTAMFLCEELAKQNKYPVLAGRVFKINFNSLEGIKEIRSFAELVNTMINIKYNPIEVSLWGKTPFLNLLKIFFTFPVHFASLTINFIKNDVAGMVVDKLAVEFPQFAKDFKKDKFKRFFKNFYKKLIFTLWTLLFLGLKGLGIHYVYQLFKKYGNKKERSPLSLDTLLYLKNKVIYDYIFYGFNGGLLGIDMASSLSYFDSFINIAQDFNNLVFFRTFQNILKTSDYGRFSAIEFLKRAPVMPLRQLRTAEDVIRVFEFFDIPLTKTEKFALRLGFTPLRVAFVKNVLNEYKRIEKQYKYEKSVANDIIAETVADLWLYYYLRDKEVDERKKKLYTNKIYELTVDYKNLLEKYHKEFYLTKQDIDAINRRVKEKIRMQDYLKSKIMKVDRPELMLVGEIIKQAEKDVEVFINAYNKAMKDLEAVQKEVFEVFGDFENAVSYELTEENLLNILRPR